MRSIIPKRLENPDEFKEIRGKDEDDGYSSELYFSNFDSVITPVQIKFYFDTFGETSGFKVLGDNLHKHGYITYNRWQDARTAIQQLHKKHIHGKPIYVNYNTSHGKQVCLPPDNNHLADFI